MIEATFVQRAARRSVLVLSLALCAVSLSAVLAGILGSRGFAAFGVGRVPMSPVGAGLMFLLGLATFLVESKPGREGRRRVGLAILVTVLVVSGGVALGYLLGRVSAHASWPVLGRPTSLLTCCATAVAACSGLFRWAKPHPSWRLRQVSALLAQAPLAIGTVVLVSYAAGAPLLYESGITPMSLPSALCSVGIGLASMVAAGCDTWPLAVFGFVPGRPRHLQNHWFTTGPLALFLLLGVLVLTSGSFFLRGQLRRTRAHVHAELSTIARFKAAQVGSWLTERRAAANRMAQAPLVQDSLKRFLAGGSQAPPATHLQSWMEAFQKGTYQRVVLFDQKGRARMSAPSGEAVGSEDLDVSELQAALLSKEVLVRDLHRHPGRKEIHFSMWVPIGPSPESGRPSEGVLLLMMDPEAFLYPLVRSWPTPSASAETLLVRREGDEVVYLNELRHRPQPAMTLRTPLWNAPAMPAAQAARGVEGMIAGIDYRDEPVLAALHQVPGMPWGMVAKVDESEVYGPLRKGVWIGGIALIGVVVVVAAGLGMMVRHHEADMVRQQLALSQRVEWLMREANDIILILDSGGTIREANRKAAEQYGYGLPELQGMKVMDLRVPETLAAAQAQFAELKERGSVRFETTHRRKDGTLFPVEVSARWVQLEDGPMVVTFIRDITEQRAQQQELQRMSRLYAAQSQINQAIVWSPTQEELLQRICRAMVEYGGFSMAWIGWVEADSSRISVAARHGDRTGLLDRVVVRSDESPEGQGAVGTAIRQECPCIINDFLGSQESIPWREDLIHAGFAAIASFPIREGGAVRGALTVYAQERDFFGFHEAALLEEAAADISYALDHLAGEARRREAEAALKESERFLREAEEAGGIGTYTWDIPGDRWKSSPILDRIFGIGPDHPRTREGWLALAPLEFRERLTAYVEGLVARRQPFDLDYPIIRPADGARRWVHGSGEFQWDAQGRPVALVGVIQDITERREDEASLRKISVAVEQSPLSVVITDPQGIIEYVNPKFTQVTGYAAQEALGQNPRILKSPATSPELYKQMWEALSRGETWVGEFENLRKDGTPFHERATIAPVRVASGAVSSYIALKEDITRQKQDEEARRDLESQLHQSQKLESLGSLAGGVAHDMNNVLGAILGIASAQREGLPSADPRARALDTIISACLRGRGVVKGLLYFARKDLAETRPVDLNALARDMVQLLSHTSLQRIGFDLDLEEGLLTIQGDPGALSHALMNLCVNAMDAMPDGGILTLRTRRTGDQTVELTVRDTGQGMAPDILAKATEPFFTTKEAGKGTGLGLSMVFGTMKAHGGSLELRSRVGEGTEVILRFPGALVPDPAEPADAPVQEAAGPGSLRVLLVDDDELIRESLSLLLESSGHRVQTARSGSEAIHYFQGGAEADLVILDMNMPGLSGAETLPRILALRPHQPVLMATGYSESDLEGILATHPTVQSLSKPFTLRELTQKMAGMMPPAAGAVRGS